MKNNNKEVFFCKKCNKKYTVSFKDFSGYLNWPCPDCGAIHPPEKYKGFAIRGCENTKY